MNSPFILIFSEIILLYFVSQKIHRLNARLLITLTKNAKITIWLMSLIFFLGTFIHELSHLLTAQLLGVATGKMKLTPSLDAENLVLGSVQIEKVGGIKRLLIGVAPFIVGLTFTILLIIFLNQTKDLPIIASVVIYYSIFVLTNCMFPSIVDLKDTKILMTLFFVIGIFLVYLSLKINLPIGFLSFLSIGENAIRFSLYVDSIILLMLSIIVNANRRTTTNRNH